MNVALFYVGVNLSYRNEGVENSFLNIFENKMKNIDIKHIKKVLLIAATIFIQIFRDFVLSRF